MLLLQWRKLVTVKKNYIHPASDTSDADDDLHDTYTEHVSFFLKVNNPSVRHPVCPRVAPVWPPSGTPVCPSVWPAVRPRPAPSLAGLKGINLLKFA
jgi:hypothetical protein